MLSQQSVYILGIINLILAGIAIFCVTIAEDYPEYFPLVYIAISIFLFYMGTIIIIIIIQIIKTCQEQHQRNQSSLDIQRSLLSTQILPQTNSVIKNNKIIIPTEPTRRLSRSYTLPLTVSLNNSHLKLPNLKDFKTASSGVIDTSTRLTLLPKHQTTFATIHKNYQSFTFINNDLRYPS